MSYRDFRSAKLFSCGIPSRGSLIRRAGLSRLASGIRTLLLGLSALTAANGLAQAADLDPPYMGSQQYPADPVEFGSGWYIRGDLGATRLPSVTTTTPTLPSGGNAAPSAPIAIISRGSDLGYDASLGGGYQVNRWFRTDVIGDFHQPVATAFGAGNGTIFCPTGVTYATTASGALDPTKPTYVTGDCTGNYTGKLKSYDVLLNGYIDIGTWYGVTPYVGAGVGMSFGHYQTASSFVMANGVAYTPPASNYTDPIYGVSSNNFNRSASGTYYNFAWAAMGGVAIDVFAHTKLDIGYRYLNLGKINGVSGTLYSNEVRAGVRYMVDN